MGMRHPQGIMPDSVLFINKRAEMLKWLLMSPYGKNMKLALLRGWGALVGSPITAAEYAQVEGSGVWQTSVDVPTAGA
jgi:hypothetical protein